MARALDILTSATLKHLRDRWWDEAFTAFLQENLQARAGNRILDVGCGTGTAELYLSRLRLSQVSLFGVDLVFERVRQAKEEAAAHNYRARYAAADAAALPFAAGVFDSTFCVAVLQHVRDLDRALSEFARVTRPGGRILAVEPDNRSRYWFSSVEGGMRAFELGSRFVAEIALARGDATDAVGPRLPALFVRHGIEPLAVHVFPVTVSHLGAPPESVWAARREAVEREIERVNDQAIRRLGRDFLKLLERYAEEARAAGASFVEIQNTLLFATVGQRRDA